MSSVPPGQMLGPYRILNQIGQGGMATVYKAYQAAMDRNVAVKILPRQLAESPEFTGRFRQEARVIARLEHAHILPVYDYGESDGYSYLVMRYLEAGTLREYLRGAQLPLAEADRLFSQLADALEYAHAQGVVHRDLKPSNVLLDERGNVFLTDFGIAKLLASDSKFTGTGAMIGTPAYMSPEQAQGVAVDQRSDIYSLGIILYEMLTGRVPFDAETPLAIILKHLNDPLPLPSSLRPDLPPAVETVLLKALAKDPAQRFATVAQFVDAWKAALPRAVTTLGRTTVDARQGAAPPPSGPPSGRGSQPPASAATPRRRSTPALLGGAAALALLLCVGAVCAVFAYNNFANRPRPTPTLGAGTSRPANTALPNANAGTPGAAGTTAAPNGTAAAGGTPAAAQPGWTSWTAANIIYTLGAADGNLLTAGAGGLTRWTLDGKVIDRLTTGNGLPGAYVFALLTEPDNHTLWVATDNGLLRIAGSARQVYNDKNGLDGTNVTALAETPQGLLAATGNSNLAGGGLLLFANNRWQAVSHFPSVPDSPRAGQLSTRVNTLRVDHAGIWWVGTAEGLGRFDGTAWQVFTTTAGLPDSNITSLGEVGGQLWAGTNIGLAIFDGTKFTAQKDVFISPVYSILATKDGSVWVTGGGGAARRAAGRTDWKVFDSAQLPSSTLYGLREAPDGSVLIGSDGGVVRILGNNLSVQRVPNVPRFVGYSSIVPQLNSDNLYMVQQYGAGLDVFDMAQQRWVPGPVLPCEGCLSLAVDGRGLGWGGGSNGLWIMSGQTQQHLTTADGLPNNQVNVVAFITSTTWVGTAGGVAVYDGQRIVQVYTAASAGLPSDGISSLLADTAGGMWVGTDAGLSHFTPAGQWQHYAKRSPFTSASTITDLAQDPTGAIWATTNGDGLYRYQAGEWQRLTASSTGGVAPIDNLNSVTVAPDGSLWFGGNFSGAAHLTGTKWQAFDVSSGLIYSNVLDIYVRPNGEVWFATGGGISRFKP